jgi:hypothetical protein
MVVASLLLTSEFLQEPRGNFRQDGAQLVLLGYHAGAHFHSRNPRVDDGRWDVGEVRHIASGKARVPGQDNAGNHGIA